MAETSQHLAIHVLSNKFHGNLSDLGQEITQWIFIDLFLGYLITPCQMKLLCSVERNENFVMNGE